MKKSFFKRSLAAILSVLMIVTSVPLAVYAAEEEEDFDIDTTWTEIASTDFTSNAINSGWTGNKQEDLGWALSHKYRYTSYANSNGALINTVGSDSSIKKMSWNTYQGTSNSTTVSADGTTLGNGLLYMTGYNGTGSTPLDGLSVFKVDIAFKLNSNARGFGDIDKYGFLRLGKETNLQDYSLWENSFFAQDLMGIAHLNGNRCNFGSGSGGSNNNYCHKSDVKQSITTNSPNLNANTEYHYVLQYSKNVIRIYITDANGVLVQNMGGMFIEDLDTSVIKWIQLGAAKKSDGDLYGKGITFKNIVFYSGEEHVNEVDINSETDKYLFAYFTGNNDEFIRMAVSDDGFNWEALNGNRQILSNDAQGECYPVVSNPSSAEFQNWKCARDPYIFRAQDGTYYVVATDLKTAAGDYDNNSKLLVWHVENIADLDNAKPWNIDVMRFFNGRAVTRAWAPEVIWDPEVEQYMLYWGNKFADESDTYIWYVYTSDFKTFSEPKILFNTGYQGIANIIDTDIYFDGNLYYCYFKSEDEQSYDTRGMKIFYATAEHASGPYAGANAMVDNDIAKLEGPEVYQLNSGDYALMCDAFDTDTEVMLMYNASSISDFSNCRVFDCNVGYLHARHGSVTKISTEQYNQLVAKYGKVTYDATAYEGHIDDVNDSLIARYFVNSDPTDDASGNGNTLAVNSITMENYQGKYAAHFAPAGSATSGNPGASSYASANGNKLMQTALKTGTSDEITTAQLNRDGMTFSWYAVNKGDTNHARFFDIMGHQPGTAGSGDLTTANTSYVYLSTKNFGMNNNSPNLEVNYSGAISAPAQWHLYTVTVSNGFITLFVDGKLYNKTYNNTGAVVQDGSPYPANIDSILFDSFKNGVLSIGRSLWSSDPMFNGYISDFRVYNKALSAKDIERSIQLLGSDIPGITDVDQSDMVYWDPFEDTVVDGVTYTSYGANSVLDTETVDHDNNTSTPEVPVHGTVFQPKNNLVRSHVYNNASDTSYNLAKIPTASTEGVTISFGYYVDDTIGNESIFNIGQCYQDGDTARNTKKYFNLFENGNLYFCYANGNETDSYTDMTNVFNGQLETNKWQFITIQIVPSGSYEILYFYIGGKLVNKIDTTSFSTFNENLSIADLFQNNNLKVYYGCPYDTGYGWGNGTGATMMDDFTVYQGVYNAEALYVLDAQRKAANFIPNILKQFEAKMAGITTDPYTNMYPAYVAYDKIKRYIDSQEKGTAENRDSDSRKNRLLAEYYVELKLAMADMQVYTGPQTIQGADKSVTDISGTISPAHTQNLLSMPNLLTKVEQTGGTAHEMGTAIYSSPFVWLYDGVNTPTAPINAAVYANDKGTWGQSGKWYNIYISASADKIQFGGNWHMTNKVFQNVGGNYTVESGWYYDSGYTKEMAYTAGVRNDSTAYSYDDMGKNKTWYGGSNYLMYTGTPTYTEAVFDRTAKDYWDSFTPRYKSEQYRNWFGGSATYTEDNGGASTLKATGDIYVINYVPVKNALTDPEILAKIKGVTTYSPASILPLLEAYDALTGIDYQFSMVGANMVKNLAQTLDENVKKLYTQNEEELQSLATQESLQMITDAIASVNAADFVDNVGQGNYTDNSWNAYHDAYESCAHFYDNLNPNAANKPYPESDEKAQALANSINESKRKLVVAADFTDLQAEINSTATATAIDTGIGTVDSQNYAYSSWKNFNAAYDNAVTTNEISTQPDANNIPKYNVDDPAYDSQDTSTWTEALYSDTQKQIADDTTALHAACADLTAPANYQVYNAAIDLLQYQDMGVFNNAYLASDESVYKLVEAEGTKYGSVTYHNGAVNGQSVTCITQNYDDAQNAAYINAEGDIYQNVPEARQAQLDAKITSILTALTEANEDTNAANAADSIRRQVTVTLNYDAANGATAPASTTFTKYYGDVATFNVADGYTCYKWKVTTNAGDVMIPGTQSYKYAIQGEGDITITAYVTKNDATVADNMVKVNVYNIYNILTNEFYVAADSTFDPNATGILPNNGAVPFYTLSGWKANTKDVKLTDGVFTVSDYARDGVIQLTPVYTPVTSQYSITLDGVAISAASELKFDDLVTLTSEGAYAIAAKIGSNYYVGAYGEEYKFYVTGSVNFFTIKQTAPGSYTDVNGTPLSLTAQEIQKLDRQLPFVFAVIDNTSQYVTYSAPALNSSNSNVVVTEYGTLYAVNSEYTTASTDTFVLGAEGTRFLVAKNPDELTGQFWVSMKTNGKTVVTRPYVKYKYSTVDANGNNVTIQTIEYGNICTNA